MEHHEFDPLAQRHGALISQVWKQLGQARDTGDKSEEAAAFWLRRFRNLKRHVLLAQRAELARKEVSPSELHQWFARATDALSKAEVHFQSRVKQQHIAKTQLAATLRPTEPHALHIGHTARSAPPYRQESNPEHQVYATTR